MMLRLVLLICCSALLLTGYALASNAPSVATKKAHAFIQNNGQWDQKARYKLQSDQGTFWICDDGYYVDSRRYFSSRSTDSVLDYRRMYTIDSVVGQVIHFRFDFATSAPQLAGQSQLSSYHNYFLGNDTTRWRSRVPLYQEVRSTAGTQGVNVRYYVQQGTLRYDVLLSPGADPALLQFHVDGADRCTVDSKGDLVLSTVNGEIRQQQLLAYQTIGSKKRIVLCRFEVGSGGAVRIKPGNYNRSLPLTIDPILWSSYIGGLSIVTPTINIQGTEDSFDMCTDAAGNPIIVGQTMTDDFPTTVGAYKRTKQNPVPPFETYEIFVSKFAANGSTLLFSTYLGGTLNDIGYGVCCSNNDTIYVCGYTNSTNFPTTSGAYSRTRNGDYDGIISKFNPTGTALVASTFIGGPSVDIMTSIKCDNSNVYVSGWTFLAGYPTTLGAYQSNNTEQFSSCLSVFNRSLSTLSAATLLGGRGTPHDLSIDAAGNMYVVGVAYDTLFPTTANAYSRHRNGIFADAYVAKVNQTCTSLLYGSYIGGEDEDIAYGVCLDPAGDVILCGKTMSDNYPTSAGAYDRSYNYVRGSSRTGDPYDEYYDGFVTKFNSSFQLLYSTYVGGKCSDWFQRVNTDAVGNAYLTGVSYSVDYPATACCIDSTQNGLADCIFTILNANGTVVNYSTFLGGGGYEIGYSISRLSNGNVYLTGSSYDLSYPTTAGAYQTVRKATDAFVTKIDPTPGLTVSAGNDILYSCVGFGTTVYLAATPRCGVGPFSYSWTPTTNLSDPHSDKPVTFTTKDGIEYQVTVTDATGATAVNTVSLVPNLLKVIPGRDTVVCFGRTARLTTVVRNGMGPKTYAWYPGKGLDDPTSPNPLAYPDSTTSYILIATDTAGCQLSDTVVVRVSHSQVRSSHDTTLCGIDSVKLKPVVSGGINPLAFRWTTVGSAVLSTSATPSFKVDSTTMFYVAITDSLGCTSRDSILVRYSPPTTLKLKADSIVCKGSPVNVNLSINGGRPPYAIRWTASDGSISLGGHDSVCTASVQKTTIFTATVIDSLGCSNVKTITVLVDSASSPHISTAANKRAICSGASLQLDAGTYANVNYLWSTGEKTQKITVKNEGWYTVTVSNKTGCVGSDSVFIRVQENPHAHFENPADTSICANGVAHLRVAGSYASIRWSNGIAGPVNDVTTAGSYFAFVTDSLGCTGGSDTVHVNIFTLQQHISGPSSLCSGQQSTFAVEGGSGYHYQWHLSGNSSGAIVGPADQQSVHMQWSGEGVDTISVFVQDQTSGCTTVDTVLIRISATLRPSLTVQGPSVLCGSMSTTILAPSGYEHYLWSTGDTTRQITVQNPGKYSVFVQLGGCSGGSDTVVITSAPPISVHISGDSSFCPGATVALNADPGFASYKWSTGDTTQSISVTAAGSYMVTVRDTNGCETSATHAVKSIATSLGGNQSLHFSDLYINQTDSLHLTIPNSSSQGVHIASISIGGGSGSAFQLTSTSPPVPGTLGAGQNLRATVSFHPVAAQAYADSLVVIVDSPCADTIVVALDGKGSDFSVQALLWMTDVYATLGTETSLPVFCAFNPTQDFNGVDCEITFHLHPGMFYPKSVSSGTITSNSIVGNERVVSVLLTNTSIRSGAELCSLSGLVLVDPDSVSITTPSIRWIAGVTVATRDSSGSLHAVGCRSDHYNLTASTPLSLLISPNPARDAAHIRISGGSPSDVSLQIFDVNGRCLCERHYAALDPDSGIDEYITDLTSGLYIVNLRSGSQYVHAPLTIVR